MMKKNKKNHSNVLAEQSISQFWSIFDHKHNFIEAENPYINPRTGKLRKPGRKKIKPDWRTETDFAIRPKVLEATFNDPNELIGLSFDSVTNKVMLDIDHLSQYDPFFDEVKFNEVLGSLEDIGLCRPVLERSSITNGLHVWYFLNEKINTFNLACAVQEQLKEDGFNITSGQLELFPNAKAFKQDRKKSFYKSIKLPLQPMTGSILLDSSFNPVDDSIEGFVRRAEWSKAGNDLTKLKRASTKFGRIVRLHRCKRSKKSLKKLKKDLLRALNQAFTGRGQTNDILLDIGAYGVIFLRLDELQHLEDLIDWMVARVTSMEGYAKYCGHQHDIRKRCMEVAKSCQDYYWAAGKPRKRDRKTFKDNFGAILADVQNGREAAKVKATQKIQKAVEQINQEISQGLHALPKNLTAYSYEIIEKSKQLFESGVSRDTLYKPYNKPFWQTAFAALVAIQITTTEPVVANPIAMQPETTAIAEVSPEALLIAKKSKESIKAIKPSQVAEITQSAKKVELFKHKPDPVARAEQSKQNLEMQLAGETQSKTKQRNFHKNTDVVIAKPAQNETIETAQKVTVTDPLESAQSQVQTGSTPCEQKKSNQNRQNPYKHWLVRHTPLYGGFGGASRLMPTDLSALEYSPPDPWTFPDPASALEFHFDSPCVQHPSLNPLEQQRTPSEHQTTSKQSFLVLRAVLAGSKAKFKRREQLSYPSSPNPSANQVSRSSDEPGDGIPPKPT